MNPQALSSVLANPTPRAFRFLNHILSCRWQYSLQRLFGRLLHYTRFKASYPGCPQYKESWGTLHVNDVGADIIYDPIEREHQAVDY